MNWPHAPLHKLGESGTYMVTAGTYGKIHTMISDDRKERFMQHLFNLAQHYSWSLQAWAIMSNHYHIIAASPNDPKTLVPFLQNLHSDSAKAFNQEDCAEGRKVWHQYWESRISFPRSYLARLHYVHENPVHHGVVRNARLYRWCSKSWFVNNSPVSFRKSVESFKIDQLKVRDDF